MVKAIVHRGEIRPLEPLPLDWLDGQQLRIEKMSEESPLAEIDRDFAELAALCASREAEDEKQLENALQEAHRQAKEQVYRRMGLA
jgi:hypothetical protein